MKNEKPITDTGNAGGIQLPSFQFPLSVLPCHYAPLISDASAPLAKNGYAGMALYICENVPDGGWTGLQDDLYCVYLGVESPRHDCCRVPCRTTSCITTGCSPRGAEHARARRAVQIVGMEGDVAKA